MLVVSSVWATHQHIEGRLGNGVRRGDLPEHVYPDAPDRARDVHDRLLAALLDERDERLRDKRGADEVGLESIHEAVELEREGGISSAGTLVGRTSSSVRYCGTTGERQRRKDSRHRRC